MTTRFLSIGECMVEMSPRAADLFGLGFAGDTFNTAWYACRAGGPDLDVRFLSCVGDDDMSRRMAAFIKGSGVTPVLSIHPDRTVGLYLISLRDGERSFTYWRGQSAARSLADDLGGLADLSCGDMAYFSGISLAILDAAGRQALLAALGDARAAGVTIAFDPNLRPRLWAGQAEMRRWILQAARGADIVLPSFDDEAAHFGDADTVATARRYAAEGAALVVVKDGPRPILIAQGAARSSLTPPQVGTVVDTTAAGDSFNARLLVGILRGELPDAAAEAACALSARVIGAPGALVETGPDETV